MVDFQRARRPEQVKQRREAILDTAAEMLAERPLAEISLRELSDRVGLAKSNVLRYFDSREAVFLELLDRLWITWLDELEPVLEREKPHPEAVATAVALSLARHALLCELISSMAGVLERNITVEYARVFKRNASRNADRLAAMVRRHFPALGETGTAHFAGAVFVIVAGLWPYARPTEAVAQVLAEMGSPTSPEHFVFALREGLCNQLVGLLTRSG
ncbi:TetR family transcriptional regulator [Allokutzneria sp. A3M-2-11 16]|uniref:TetR/AcrR family transcriptional regulator n=1 Tax=Allokutzneria sp. A3M-2-11 16 TaxID=2962043 RepID=UPI0020B78B85|nr:TetR family transcriptional regulator [Allokutzneria sp. A3M-2-11 16]MCP3803809.1 TetR family transcriptional regulator [Allokutzneria sp. A3M-2-11 16]